MAFAPVRQALREANGTRQPLCPTCGQEIPTQLWDAHRAGCTSEDPPAEDASGGT